jgi:hypothetical protein
LTRLISGYAVCPPSKPENNEQAKHGNADDDAHQSFETGRDICYRAWPLNQRDQKAEGKLGADVPDAMATILNVVADPNSDGQGTVNLSGHRLAVALRGEWSGGMTRPIRARYTGHRFACEIISHAVWLYFRFPLRLRMVEELLAARGIIVSHIIVSHIIVSHETVRQWARKFGQQFANRIRRRLPRTGDKWHLDEVVLKIAGVKHWLWRAVDQTGIVLDVLVQRRRDKQAAKRLLRKLLKKQM